MTAWAKLRASLPSPPHLLTFDFHTDTLPAFNVYAYKALRLSLGREPKRQEHLAEVARLSGQIDFAKSSSIDQALRWLRHDEHVDAAQRAGIIDKIAVILSTQAPGNERDIARLFPAPIAPTDAAQAAALLDAATLAPTLSALEKSWGAALKDCVYICDIDLDFFRSARAIAPKDPSVFHHLLKHAALITIARESVCVEQGRLPGESITADSLLLALEAHIAAART